MTRRLLVQLFNSPLAVLERRKQLRGRRVPLLLAIAGGVPMLVFFLRLYALWPKHHFTPATICAGPR